MSGYCVCVCVFMRVCVSGVDPGFSERGSDHKGISLMQGVWGHSPPEATGFLL